MSDSIFPRQTVKNTATKPNFNNKNCENLRIVQWNIYAQGLVVSDGFQYCSLNDMNLDKRKKMFRKEFLNVNADIYCLQEADIHSTLCDILNENTSKYEDIFFAKTNSPCLLYSENFGPDGCCILYNKEKLECIHRVELNLEKTGSYVSLFVIFCFKSNPKLKFVVACTHLKSKKHFQLIRVIQCKLLLAKFLELMSLWDITSGFLCGDFNANPDEDVIKEIQQSMLNFVNVYDFLRENQNLEEYYTSWVFKKEESLSKRARSNNPVYSDKKRITESEINEVIDYIWFIASPSPLLQIDSSKRTSIFPLSIEDVPKKKDIGDHGIPSVNTYPSDHLSLIADYIIGITSL